eukprot:1151958-Pelagomonas_calceolata.AAC.5
MPGNNPVCTCIWEGNLEGTLKATLPQRLTSRPAFNYKGTFRHAFQIRWVITNAFMNALRLQSELSERSRA